MVTMADCNTIQFQCLASSIDMAWFFIFPLLNHLFFVYVEEREGFIISRMGVRNRLIDK